MNPSRLPLRLVLVLLALLGGAWAAFAAPAYPLEASANGRYLVGQDGAPFLVVGDSPQSLIVNLDEAAADSFFADRAALGFNTLWVNLLCTTYTGGRADASLLDGTLPFTATLSGTASYDLTAPNEAYFQHVDRVLALAAKYGLMVLLDPIETGGFLGTMRANGTTRCRTFGRWLGARYAGVDNVLWLSGNDFQTWSTPSDDAVVREVALGILDLDTRHLHTVELNYLESSSLDDPNWNAIAGLNAVYSYYPTYGKLRADYGRTGFRPNLMVEANYEFESLYGPVTTAAILRRQAYWTMTSGAAGQMYGNGQTWPFLAGWRDHLDTPGAAQMAILRALFEPRAWYALVPDTAHALVTAGYGSPSRTGYVAANDYLTAAATPDGRLAIAFTPVQRTFTVDLSRLGVSITARWFDPSRGTWLAVAGSPLANVGTHDFTPPGANGDGDGGWVLVLETAPPETVPPSIAITAPAPNATVADSFTVTANATDNVGVAGVQFQLDGADLGPERLAPPWSAGSSTRAIANGPHLLRAIARDLAGNHATATRTIVVAHPVAPVPTDHLAAAYAFDEGSGAALADASGNANAGVLLGAAFTAGRHGTALAFDGAGGYAEVPDSPSLDVGSGGLTIAFWARITDAPGGSDQVLIAKPWNAADMTSPFFQFGIEYLPGTARTLGLSFGDPAGHVHGPFRISPVTGAWSYVAFTYDGATVTGYRDGVEVLRAADAGSIAPRGHSLRLGCDGAYRQFFAGALDDVRLYGRALSAAEIQGAMQTAVPDASTGAGGPGGPPAVTLSAPAPNPFRDGTRLAFVLPAAAGVELGVFDAAGRRVRRLAHATFSAGEHEVEWDGTDAAGRPVRAGRYFVRLRSGDATRSLALVRLQ